MHQAWLCEAHVCKSILDLFGLARRTRRKIHSARIMDDATRKVVAAGFLPTEDARDFSQLLRRLRRRYGVLLSFYGDRHGVSVCNDQHWSVESGYPLTKTTG
jgi:hypothetical protein